MAGKGIGTKFRPVEADTFIKRIRRVRADIGAGGAVPGHIGAGDWSDYAKRVPDIKYYRYGGGQEFIIHIAGDIFGRGRLRNDARDNGNNNSDNIVALGYRATVPGGRVIVRGIGGSVALSGNIDYINNERIGR